MKQLNTIHALASEITIEVKRWQDSESSPLVAAIDRDILNQKIRALYQMISEIKTVSSDELLEMIDEDLMPEVEVEFNYDDDMDDMDDMDDIDEKSDSIGSILGSMNNLSYSSLEELLHRNKESHSCSPSEDQAKSSLRDKLEHSRSNIPCPHHINNDAPLSHLVNTISSEYSSEESTQKELTKAENETEISNEKTIELIVSEMNEPQEQKEQPKIEEWGPKSDEESNRIENNSKADSNISTTLHNNASTQECVSCNTLSAVKIEALDSSTQNNTGAQQVILFGQTISHTDQSAIINELFDADERKFEEQVSLLEKMESLDDALIHIGQNYSWRGDNQVANEFIALLDLYFEPSAQ